MLIKPEKVNNVRNRFLEHIGLSMVVFLGSFLAIFYLMIKRGNRRRDSLDFLIYLLENPWVYMSICGLVMIFANVAFYIMRFDEKTICALEFKDESQELIIYLLPYYSNTPKSMIIPFTEYSLEVLKKESTQGKYLHLTIKQNGIPVGTINGNDTFWAGQKKTMDKVIHKSVALGKRENRLNK